MIEVPELIFENQLCAKWDVSPDTLYRERKAGKLRCTPIGGRIAYTQEQINDYLRLKAEEAATQPCRRRQRERVSIQSSRSSGNTGSSKSRTAPTSTSAGTTETRGKSAAEALGREYFKKQRRN